MRVFSQHLRGTTLIEALILVFILGIITVAFYQAWSTGTRLILETRNRLGALSVANEKMEIAHNLTYAQIGTKTSNGQGGWNYGIPGGDILQDEDITSNNHTYHVHTFVQYVDDAFDGKVSGTNPLDTVPSDYKKVEITVSWSDGTETHTLD
jgi:type II secretory pathway pseudopilin PulG